MFAYVFAFYLKTNNQSLIFEYNKRDLEKATEKLSKCLSEKDQNFYYIRNDIQNKMEYE